MPWRPSKDPKLQRAVSTAFWSLVESFYDNAAPLDPLKRFDWDRLRTNYVLRRNETYRYDVNAMRGRLPSPFRSLALEQTEIDILDLVLNYSYHKLLLLQGSRGCGKTTLLHYLEAVTIRAAPASAPFFIILDFRLDRAEDLSRRSLLDLIAFELSRSDRPASQSSSPSVREAQQRVASALTSPDISISVIANALAPLCDLSTVIVFDNLDQLSRPCLERALEIAKKLQLNTQLTCIACIRPNALEGIYRRGSAREYFNLTIHVSPPHIRSWLLSLSKRIAAVSKPSLDATPVTLYGLPISSRSLGLAFDALTTLLTCRDHTDDVSAILQAVCADDTRHLCHLVRRLLQHPKLPASSLLNQDAQRDSVSYVSYHPLSAVIEGPHSPFQANKFVPNLLFFQRGRFPTDFLIFHCVLVLLADSDLVATDDLFAWLDVLGYTREFILNALQILHEALLVRATDTVLIDKAHIPEDLFLTDAGWIYHNYLLSSPDYLTNVILDVPLEHAALKELASRPHGRSDTEISFADKLVSLEEYSQEVVKQEQAQLRMLQAATPSPALWRVADGLRIGGLLSNRLKVAFETIVARSAGTKSDSLHKLIPRISEKAIALSAYILRMSSQYEAVANRGRKYKKSQTVARMIHIPTAGIYGESRMLGTELHIKARQPERGPLTPSFIMLTGTAGPDAFSTAALMPRKDAVAPVRLSVAGGGSDAEPVIRGGHTLAVGAELRKNDGRATKLALLCTSLLDKRMHVELLIDGSNLDKPRHFNAHTDFTFIKRHAERCVFKVGISACEPESSFCIETVQTFGTSLGSHIFEEHAHRLLRTCLQEVEVLIIAMSTPLWSIPWEWCRPQPSTIEDDPPILSQEVEVIRWPLSILNWMGHQHHVDSKSLNRPVGRYCCVGLNANDAPWRLPLPSTYLAFRTAVSQFDTVHIVGHFVQEDDEVFLAISDGSNSRNRRNLRISLDQIKANPFASSASTVVISACKVGLAMPDESFPAGIVSGNQTGCQVWATAVNILESNALNIDSRLAALEATESISSFFRNERRNNNAFAALYVRYGI